MSTINVLVCVNVAQALATGNLSQYIFMVDTTGYSGNGNEGGNELLTTCHNGDTVVWTVQPIDPTTTAAIQSFQGTAVPNMISPQPDPQTGGTSWQAKVNQAGTTVQYSMTLLLQGVTAMSFDPFLTATNVQSEAHAKHGEAHAKRK